jgi:hypothetical protein
MHQTEADALDRVRSRLVEQFPDIGEAEVASAMSAAHAEMTGPVRDYVPVLVEHAVRKRLTRQLGHPPRPITTVERPQG